MIGALIGFAALCYAIVWWDKHRRLLGFADPGWLGERDGLTPPRDLYQPGYPWADPVWPADRT